ncbi:hypothetical protein SNEBB_000559 [Seison nebaliae]|nr:hypothetical protein SNEBB_000559 [Seison nebaliae]
MICAELIRNTKNVDARDFVRWNELISDVLTGPSVLGPNTIKDEVYPFSYTWFPHITLLSLDVNVMLVPQNPTISYSFEPDYKKYFAEMELENLDRKLISNKINPKLIMIGFGVTCKYIIHPTFYYSIRTLLPSITRNDVTQQIDSTSIYYYAQTMSVPQLHDGRNVYPFLVNGIMKEYDLKSIAIMLRKEFEIKIGEIASQYDILPSNIENVQMCTNSMVGEVERILIHSPLENGSFYMKHPNLLEILRKVCVFLLQDAYKRLIAISPVHMVALVERNNKWIIMNDDISSFINNIEKFTEALKHEMITSVLLEEKI